MNATVHSTAPVTYQGSWRNPKGLGIVSVALGALIAIEAWAFSSPFLWLAFASLAGWLLGLGRLSVRLGDGRLVYQGWFRRHDVSLDEITSITRTLSLPYPKDRYFGPLCYEVRAGDQKFVINLLYFPGAFAREFSERFLRTGRGAPAV